MTGPSCSWQQRVVNAGVSSRPPFIEFGMLVHETVPFTSLDDPSHRHGQSLVT